MPFVVANQALCDEQFALAGPRGYPRDASRGQKNLALVNGNTTGYCDEQLFIVRFPARAGMTTRRARTTHFAMFSLRWVASQATG